MQAEDILKENTRRKKIITRPYNPVTGEGCNGDRVRLNIEDAPFTPLYLPRAMMDNEVCLLLKKHQSVAKIFESNGEAYTKQAYYNFWIKFCELRYRYDFEYFAITCITIRDKITARDIPFTLNRGQRKLLENLEKMRLANQPIRIMVLKARQWGGSTLIQLYMLWIQLIHKRNWNSVICAHLKDGSITIRSMFERAIRNMIPLDGVQHIFKSYQGTQNIREVPGRGCLITVGTAIEPDSVRSQDAKMVHFSEMAFYPNAEKNKTEDLETSVVGSIPSEPYTLIARESTANGTGDYFNREWEKAKKGETAYEAVFVEWFLIDIYSKPFDGNYYNLSGKPVKGSMATFASSLTPYELNLFNNHAQCTLENLNWRRAKRAEMASEAKMKQEYPSDDMEAFQDSGSPAFRAEDVEALRKDCKLPVTIGDLVSSCPPALSKTDPARRKAILSDINFIEDRPALEAIQSSDPKLKALKESNRLRIWEFPDKSEKISNRYVVVYDPSKGITDNADFGVIAVFDRYPMISGDVPGIVAEWRGHEDKDIVIWIAAQIATFYNNALLVVESNTYDSENREDDTEFIFDTIARYYTNLYSRTPADKIMEGVPVKYGFNTNRSTKSMIIANYVATLREKGYTERNEEALNEARVYEKKKNGSYGAKEGRHDDILMTRMIGCYICYELPLPKELDILQSRSVIKKPVGISSF